MKKNILITSAGRRVSLINYFKKELKNLVADDARVFCTDLNPALSSACQVADGAFRVGKFTDADYIDTLVHICKTNEIGLLIPTIDTELLLLINNKNAFDNIGCKLILSSVDIIKICRDKRLTNIFFSQHGFNVPTEYNKSNIVYPTFIKPYNGSSSNNLLLANSSKDICENVLANSDMMFLEYLPKNDYDEYTVDIYYNKLSQIKCIVPRLRMETRHGEISKGLTVKNFIVEFVFKNLDNISGFIGCITLQLFAHKTNSTIYGIEINPRFGGGYPLSYLANANFPAWIIKEYILDEEISFYADWKENLLLLRHDNELVIENYEKKI